MKTLIINGSPRKAGGTASLIAMLRNQIHGEVDEIPVYYADVSPCLDCRYCWEHDACCVDDAMQEIYRQIDEADCIVLASPIYFGQLTGPLLSWASRLQYFWIAANNRRKPALQQKLRRGAVLLVDGGDGFMEEALRMGQRLLRAMGAQPVGHVYFSGTDRKDPTLPGEALGREIAALAEKLAAE